MKKYTVIANWKMYLSFNHALDWIKKNKEDLETLILNKKCTTIICPSFETLFPFKDKIKNSSIHLGAQDCSAFTSGAYTGQVQAASLQQLGCSYCIIGHSETRSLLCQTSSAIIEKLRHLFDNSITPLICIGESHQQRTDGQSIEIIERQLNPLQKLLKSNEHRQVYIAYEPIWAIGTGNPATPQDVAEMFYVIKSFFNKNNIKNKLKLLYGGSINSKNSIEFTHVELLDGFLIGKASTDYQQLSTIISNLV